MPTQTLTTPGTTLIPAKTPVIQGTPLWHIIVVSLAAGVGLAVACGLIILGVEYFEEAKQAGKRFGGAILATVASLVCIGAIAVGIYAMVNPPKSKPLKVDNASGGAVSTTVSPILKTPS
jgi:hypothetical protein